MSTFPIVRLPLIRRAFAIAFAVSAFNSVHAAVTDISTTPLAASAGASVLPNLLFTLDSSGSMGWDFMGDHVDPVTSVSVAVNKAFTCKTDANGDNWCQAGDPPYFAAEVNGVIYNPQITYRAATNYDGTSKGDQTNYTLVQRDPFTSPSSKIDLTTQYPEFVWCNSSALTDCKRNGISTDTGATFNYRSASTAMTNGLPQALTVTAWSYNKTTKIVTVTTVGSHGWITGDAATTTISDSAFNKTAIAITVTGATTFTYSCNCGSSNKTGSDGMVTRTTDYVYPGVIYGTPFYYTITPAEYCSEKALINCQASAGGAFTEPAYVRYCKTSKDAHSSTVVTGTGKCQAKFHRANGYIHPRYGQFTRSDINAGIGSYGGRPLRTDCAAAPVCTYAEEMTNFANWYAYYRTRMLMMKTATGIAFLPIDDRYRVGFITINPGSPVSSSKYLKVDTFGTTQKQNWYTKLYSQVPTASTPLREALSRAGRHFAGKTDGINQGMNGDPIQYSCQQNFHLLTTDGYWNGNAGKKLDQSAMGNQDNADSGLSKRSLGVFDGNLSGSSDSLADVAQYYYANDLRPSGSTGALGTDVSLDNVPTNSKDSGAWQHMTTFTLGLVDGVMQFQADYESNSSSDFNKIKSGATAPTCSWQSTGICDWPVPVADTPTALDDLWHAAVSGRGTYFQAGDPEKLAQGLGTALAGLQAATAAAAASATSTPNVTQTDNAIFSSTYVTMEWHGEVVARTIDPMTGTVDTSAAPTWTAQALLDTKAAATSDTRTIYAFDSGGTNKLRPFLWANLNATEQGYFSNKCSTSALSQCITLNPVELLLANNGSNMVNFLRGQSALETLNIYRDRKHILGDTVNAKPSYVRAPTYAFADAVTPDYAAFKTANLSRQAELYIAANDGMLHALNASSGQESWAYVPSMVMPNMYDLADINYATQHKFFVDGSPEIMDIFSGGQWKTILVGGLNSGGRGYYALDITDPNSPKGLWEFCHSATLCAISDADLGMTYGNPVITKRASDSKWVVLVTSGYNNISPGNGVGYLYVLDAESGTILQKISTGTGSTTTPAGLGKIAAWADNGNLDNTAKYVYGGDLRGNVWRFNLTTSPATVMKLGELKDASGRPQSVTARPELGEIMGNRVVFFGTGRYLGTSDLVDPATWVPASTDAYQHTLYALKDKGVSYGNVRTGATLVQQNINVISATSRTTTTNSVDWTTKDGWYVDFNPGNETPGERINLDMTLILGTLVVLTNVPNTDACNIGGESWVYQFNYQSGSFVSTSPGQVVGVKLANAIAVGMVAVGLPTGAKKGIATDAKGVQTTFGINIGGTAASGKRTSWRELIRQ